MSKKYRIVKTMTDAYRVQKYTENPSHHQWVFIHPLPFFLTVEDARNYIIDRKKVDKDFEDFNTVKEIIRDE